MPWQHVTFKTSWVQMRPRLEICFKREGEKRERKEPLTADCDMNLFWASIACPLQLSERKKKRKMYNKEVALGWNRTYLFLRNKLKIPNLSPWLPPPSSFSLSLTVSVLYLHLSPSLCSGSGSGNRSVTCHYWSNSVIRHRALTVCSTLYAGAAGVLRTEVEIRFDTHTQARGPTGARADRRRVCECVCVHLFVCVCIRESGRGKQKDWEIEFFCACVYAFLCTCVCCMHIYITSIEMQCNHLRGLYNGKRQTGFSIK